MEPFNQGVQYVEVGPEADGQRVDNFLLGRLRGLPRSRLYRLIRKGEIRVNKKRIKPDSRLDSGDVVRLPPLRLTPAEATERPGAGLARLIRESVIFDRNGLMVLNKPAGLAVHGGSGLRTGLIEAMRHVYSECDYLELVHRIDRDTSGCLMIARDPALLKDLHRQLKEKTLEKRYQLLVHGRWPPTLLKVEAPLQKNEVKSGERIVTVSREGKSALTRFRILKTLPGATLVEASPITGRTHQIRVHCQHAGHPIVGDQKYSYRARGPLAAVKQLCLHAAEISFNLPGSEEKITVSAPLNDSMEELIARLGGLGPAGSGAEANFFDRSTL